MGLSDLLGSLSPGFGLFSGKGMFGGGKSGGLNGLAGSGLFGLLGLLLHHGDHTPSTPAPAAPGSPPTMTPGMSSGLPAHMNTPDLGQLSSQLPGMSSRPSPFAALGSSLQSSGAPDPGLQLNPASFGMAQPNNGLHALLQQILGQ